MHAVELHAQVGDTGAGFFAAFKFEQKTIAVALNRAQFVQVGVAAVVDDAAVANQRGGFVEQIAPEQVGTTGWRLQIIKNFYQKGR